MRVAYCTFITLPAFCFLTRFLLPRLYSGILRIFIALCVGIHLFNTSAQLGYTVPFTLVHAGKYRTEDKLKSDTTKTKHNPEKNKQHKTQQNKTTLV